VDGLLEDPDVWNNPENAQKLGKEKRMLESVVNTLNNLETGILDSQELFEMAKEENDDESLLGIASDSEVLEKTVEEMEFRRMFSEPMDENNCFIELQSGSGGTEAQDWANMLLRMYLRYCERKDFKVEVLPVCRYSQKSMTLSKLISILRMFALILIAPVVRVASILIRQTLLCV
jgi:peptide chain release factor 2